MNAIPINNLPVNESALYSEQALPTGTLTFLFTDIESSTLLWEQYPEEMRGVMKRHDTLVEEAVGQHAGRVIRPRGEGDSRFAVFSRASDALLASIAIQHLLIAEPWTVPALRVRIGLHTGEADLRDGDYYGRSVNRCARLRNAAHGGQILLSESTYSLVRDALPMGVSLHDLGEHTLKDLERPEHIYQPVVAYLPAKFPPIKTTDQALNNLPLELTSFVGRERELAELERLIWQSRLVTITGSGGAGKTRLATRAGQIAQISFPDGVWFIDLARLSKTSLLSEHIMNVLGIQEEPGFPPAQTLRDALKRKYMLLILDNCEHLLPEVAMLAESLLRSAPRLRILATSREKLGVSGETIWRIPSLSTPGAKGEPGFEEILQYEAVKLFQDRAAASRPDFTITPENARAVAQICAHLDGIPLAIELAAARVNVLSIDEIGRRLNDRFRLLVGSKTALPRQQTLRALVNWSHELLTEKERMLLRRLSVFAGGWTLEAAEQVCTSKDIEPMEVLDLITCLIDKSFVIGETQNNQTRYRFLETIQEFCHERLSQSYETGEFELKHATYFMNLAANAYGKMWGVEQVQWLQKLDDEYDNLRAALARLSRDAGKEEMLLQMAGCLWRYWEIRGHFTEGRTWIDIALSKNPKAEGYLRANGLAGAGHLARQQGDYERAKSLHDQSLHLFRKMGYSLSAARQLSALGEIAQYQGDYTRAAALHEESLALRKEIGDKEGIAVSLRQLGVIARDRSQYQLARTLLEESLELERELGDKILIALSLNDLGLVAYHLCEYGWAVTLFEEAISLQRELNTKAGISNTLLNLGSVAKDLGDFREAESLYQQSLALKKELGDKRGICQTIAAHAEAVLLQGKYAYAAELARESLSLSQELGVKRVILHSLLVLGFAAYYQGDYETAASYAEKDLALSKEIDAPQAEGYSYVLMALDKYSAGGLTEAKAIFQEAMTIFQKIHDCRNVARTFVNLARTAYRQGDDKAAMAYLEESLEISRERNIRWTLGYVLEIMGLIKRNAGDYEGALELFQESLSLAIEQENEQGIANCLGALAGLAVLSNQPGRAARLFAAAARLRRDMGAKMSNSDHAEYEKYVTMLHEHLDHATFEAEWSEGFMMTTGNIIKELNNWLGSFHVATPG